MSPLLEQALKAINSRTNLETGLTHPNDMNAVKQMFVILHDAGEILLANEISSWAEGNGWKPRDAKELGELGAQIGMGKQPKIQGQWWNEKILDVLKEQIK